MKRLAILFTCLLGLMLMSSGVCQAGRLGPGKYCGVVIFDRWDGCTLYSGIYVMYVSEKVKEGLRPYAGQAIQIDAKEVDQPHNPGDGRIGRFEYLGPAPKQRNWIEIEGIGLKSSVEIQQDGKPVATIHIENTSQVPVKLFSQELALTLLTKREDPKAWSVSDGPSYALITRQSFEVGSDPRWEGTGYVARDKTYTWTIGKPNALPHDFTLAPGEKKVINVRFDLPDGEYEFLCGYGGNGEKGVASNLSAFDVKQTKAEIVKGKPR